MKPVTIVGNWKFDMLQELWSQCGTGTLELSKQGWKSWSIFAQTPLFMG